MCVSLGDEAPCEGHLIYSARLQSCLPLLNAYQIPPPLPSTAFQPQPVTPVFSVYPLREAPAKFRLKTGTVLGSASAVWSNVLVFQDLMTGEVVFKDVEGILKSRSVQRIQTTTIDILIKHISNIFFKTRFCTHKRLKMLNWTNKNILKNLYRL